MKTGIIIDWDVKAAIQKFRFSPDYVLWGDWSNWSSSAAIEGKYDIESSAKVRYYDTYKIIWEAGYGEAGTSDSSLSSYSAEYSQHELYLTLNTPTTDDLYETVFHISCTNANGQSTPDNIVAGIWSGFSDRNVSSKAGTRFKYWLSETPSQTLPSMLASTNGDSSCLAFSYLFQKAITVQGLSASILQLKPKDGDGFLVKNWAYGNNINAGENHTNDSTLAGDDISITPSAIYNWVCIIPGNNLSIDSTLGVDDVIKDGIFYGTSFPYVCGVDVMPRARILAQGNDNSPKSFLNHFIVKAYSKFYDPSYGGDVYTSELSHENAAIDGIYKKIEGITRVRKNDISTLDLRYSE